MTTDPSGLADFWSAALGLPERKDRVAGGDPRRVGVALPPLHVSESRRRTGSIDERGPYRPTGRRPGGGGRALGGTRSIGRANRARRRQRRDVDRNARPRRQRVLYLVSRLRGLRGLRGADRLPDHLSQPSKGSRPGTTSPDLYVPSPRGPPSPSSAPVARRCSRRGQRARRRRRTRRRAPGSSPVWVRARG